MNEKQLLLRGETIIGEKNVALRALVDKAEVHLPTMYVKFGLIEIFLKAMNEEGEGFVYLRHKFPRIIEAKLKKAFWSVFKENRSFKTPTLEVN
jgi:hypothetical protein